MSYVGSPFEYDVFLSYAHAETETDAPVIREWSKYIATRLRDLLASALNPSVDSNYRINFFIDDRVLVSGQPLPETLRENVERSALLLVLMSPLYPKKHWCIQELDWFLAQAGRDGRGQQHCVVLRTQDLSPDTWPTQLTDGRGEPVFFHDLANADTELPLGAENENFDVQELKDAIRKIFIEIKGKLKELKKQIGARRLYEQTVTPPDQPVVYLHARVEDLSTWEMTRAELARTAIVNPDSLPIPIEDDALLRRHRDQRIREYSFCDAIVLLRARSDDAMRIEVMAAYKDRQQIFQDRHLNIPWAILDRIGTELPVAATYRIPRVIAKGPDWPNRLLQTLGLGLTPRSGAA